MEGLILLGLLGGGWLLNKDKEDSHKVSSNFQPPLNYGSNDTIYDVSNYKDSKQYEQELVRKQYEEAMKGNSTVIDGLNMEGRNTLRNTLPSEESYDSMSGTKISEKEFLKNDQGVTVEPFFSGSAPNVNYDENIQLERHQGYNRRENEETKKELGQFFPTEKTYGNVFGNANAGPNVDQSRYIPGDFKTNELPFEQEKISHIDQKSEINRDVGYLHSQRNNVDNQRALSNPKLSFGGKLISGKGFDKRQAESEVFKHGPDQDYENKADRWLVTTGAISSQKIRPEQVMKETNRQYLNQGNIGSAAPVVFQSSEDRPMFKKSSNQQLSADTTRNASLSNRQQDDDHGKDSFFSYPNEREITQERTYEGNLKSVYTAETTPIQDGIKTTIKETTLDDTRNGFVGSSITNVPKVGLQDDLRPTVKDTTHYGHTGNAGSYLSANMSTDQYLRADMNPNKEIISQGRDPTPENTKLSSGVDTLNVDVQKIESDYFNPRINNADKLYQEIPVDLPEKYTQDRDTLDNVKLSDRLDPTNLDPFRENPYTQSLSSFAY